MSTELTNTTEMIPTDDQVSNALVQQGVWHLPLAIRRSDNGVSIMRMPIFMDPATMTSEELTTLLTEDPVTAAYLEYCIQVWQSSFPEASAVGWRVISMAALPDDRTFRNAWTDDNPTETIDVDMDKAKVIHLDNLREERKPELQATDIEFFKALEEVLPELLHGANKDKLLAVIAKKQALRDATQVDLSEAATPDELKATRPAILIKE